MIGAVQNLEISQMDSEIAEDLALAQRIASGDESALKTLYQSYADPLYAFICHSMEGDQSEAEEVWQESLEAAVRMLPTYRGQCRFFSWICGIARHKLADYWRQKNRSRQHLSLMPPENLARLMDEGPLPDEVVGQRATCLWVVEILGLLPQTYRNALVARYADGLSVEEIAKSLDKSYKATESLLSRAKEAFRNALADRSELEL